MEENKLQVIEKNERKHQSKTTKSAILKLLNI